MNNFDYENDITSEEQVLLRVKALLGRDKLSKNEQWMFDNYWSDKEFEFRKDVNGKLSIHKITR
jgi:hypothetical protein